MWNKSNFVPRLTRRMTAEVIADQRGGEVSNILRNLDKRAGRDASKRARANLNPVLSWKFALRHAVDSLGIEQVATILGVGEASLRKAANPNESGRDVDTSKISVARLIRLVRALRHSGHGEFVSAALQAEGGDGTASVRHLPSIFHALSLATATRGEVARQLVLATEGGRKLSNGDVAVIAEAIDQDQRAGKILLEQLLADALPEAH